VVFDAAGKSSFGQCKRLLKPGGIYMSTGPGPWDQNLILLVRRNRAEDRQPRHHRRPVTLARQSTGSAHYIEC
jgi:hypothetical protein